VGTCCFQNGAYRTLQKLGKLLQEHEMEDAVELRATFCFENCSQGPNIAVNGRVIGNATPERAGQLFVDEIQPLVTGEPAGTAG